MKQIQMLDRRYEERRGNRVAVTTLKYNCVDYSVFDGDRSVWEQRVYRRGASRQRLSRRHESGGKAFQEAAAKQMELLYAEAQ